MLNHKDNVIMQENTEYMYSSESHIGLPVSNQRQWV